MFSKKDTETLRLDAPSQEPREDNKEMQIEDFPRYSETTGELFKALSKARAEFPFIKTDGENDKFNSKYATLSNIMRNTTPVLSKYNLVVTQLINEDEYYTYLTAILGLGGTEEYITSRVVLSKRIKTLDSSGKEIIKQLKPWDRGSEITYFQRYAYASLLGITITNDDDGRKAMSLYADKKQIVKPKITERDLELLQHEIGEDENLLLTIKNNLELNMLADMPASQLKDAFDLIKRAKKGKIS